MTLVLTADADPGTASWQDASVIGGGETLLLVVPIAVNGAAPAIDPDGLRNICYVMAVGVTSMTAVLPEITGSLSPVWRVTVAGGGSGAICTLSPAVGDTIVNLAVQPDALIYGSEDEGGAQSPGGGIFVHDGANSWAVWGNLAVGP